MERGSGNEYHFLGAHKLDQAILMFLFRSTAQFTFLDFIFLEL